MSYLAAEYDDLGKYAAEYVNNKPFPHIVFDNFIDEKFLNKVVDEFPDLRKAKNKIEFNNQLEVKLASKGSRDLSKSAKELINFLNSDEFLFKLQSLTNIDETLISDPYLTGAGYHEIKKGGLLKVHADFNKHPDLDLDRRLNLLLYLNKDWEEEWGGNLELYARNNLKKPAMSIMPIFNRCVIFSTTSYTYHGLPDPLNCPESRSRKSIALYYFSCGRPKNENSSKEHATIFVPTKNEKFYKYGLKDFVKDLVPPIFIKCLKKILKR